MNKTDKYKYILDLLKQKKEFKFAFIGDSITSAEWVTPNWRGVFEYILKYSFEELPVEDRWIPTWNLKFFNYSLDGGTTRDFRKQVDVCIKEVKPDCVIVMGTSNDIANDISVKEHLKNLNKIFNKLSKRTKFFVYSPDIYSKDEELNLSYKPYLEAVSNSDSYLNKITVNGYEEFGKYDLDKIFTLKLSDEEKEERGSEIDLVHPNQLGNVYIAKMFLENIFGIEVNPEKFLKESRNESIKYPSWR